MVLFQCVALWNQPRFREIPEDHEPNLVGFGGCGVQHRRRARHGKDQHQHDERLEAVLKRLLEAGVTLNLDKCVFSTKQAKFLGHVISSNGIEVDPDKEKAIADLPTPTNVQEVRTFLGMVNQLSKFSDHLADKTKSIRALLLKGNKWTWGNAQQKASSKSKWISRELQY